MLFSELAPKRNIYVYTTKDSKKDDPALQWEVITAYISRENGAGLTVLVLRSQSRSRRHTIDHDYALNTIRSLR